MIIDDAFPTITAAATLLRERRVSSVELTQRCLERIARHDPVLHAYVTVAHERALADAERADREIAAGGYRGALHGVPYALKDVYDARGLPTTGGSGAFLDRVPDTDAAVTERLERAGAVLLGKLTTHELTYGGVDFGARLPPARNPWDSERDPGGSSSGAGAALAAGMCLAALGTDTGGSVRLPAGLCGVAGLKPTFGRVSRRGVMLNSYSLDHCGPMAWTVADCALLLQAIAGHDPADPASVDTPVSDYAALLDRDIRGLRIGLVAHFFERDLPAGAEARAAIADAVDVLRGLGATVREIELAPLEDYARAKAVIQRPEIFSIYGDEVTRRPEAFGPKLRQRISAGDCVPAVDYVRAQAARRALTAQMAEAMRDLDALVTCGAYGPAPPILDVAAQPMRNQPEITVPFSMTGFPAISVCAGFSSDGMPLALQVVGKPFEEGTVLRVASAYERATPWRKRRPALSGIAQSGAYA